MFFPFHDENPTQRTPFVTFGLIAVNVAAYLWLVQLEPLERHRANLTFGFIPGRVAQLTGQHPQPIVVPLGPPVEQPGFPFGRVVQRQLKLPPDDGQIVRSVFTCMFLHAGLWHLVGNMWFLWLFGNNVEDRLGPLPYLLVYLVGGLAASACHWATDPNSLIPVIGASGAVATVLGAYFITWPWARVHTLVFLFIFITIIDVPAVIVLGVWFLGQLLSGHQALQAGQAEGVAWWAHVGGFLAGLVLMPLTARLVGAPPLEHKAGRRLRSEHDDEVEQADWW